MPKKETPYKTLFDLDIRPAQSTAVIESVGENEWCSPDSPDPDFIDLVHRGHDGYVCLAKKRTEAEKAALPPTFKGNPDFDQLVSIPARTLPGLFGQIVDALEADSYCTINGMSRPAHWDNKRGYVDEVGQLLKSGYRKNADVKWLTACWVDLDCHSLGITIGQAIGAVIDAVNEKRIPRPSILLDSGRGCWCFWLLCGDSPADPLRNNAATLPLWQATIGKIRHTFAALGADAAATDLARICRIPGSINTKAERRASYLPWLDLSGTIRTYKLDQLALEFGLDTKRIPPTPPKQLTPAPPQAPSFALTPATPTRLPANRNCDRVKNSARQNAGLKGWKAKWKNERHRFYTLLRLRHRFGAGHRNHSVFILANILKNIGLQKDEAIEQIRTDLMPHLEQTPDSYTEAHMLVTVRQVYTKAPIDPATGYPIIQAHTTIANWLDIDTDEAQQTGWPPAQRHGGPAPPPPAPATVKRETRRAALKAIVDANAGEPPPIRDLLAALTAKGVPTSHATVITDLEALGFTNPRSPGRPRQTTGRTLFE